VVAFWSDCYCINCGCRPLVYHMRNQWEPDGLQVPKPVCGRTGMSEQIQAASRNSRRALRKQVAA
jgi:hypothetical protein